MNNNLKTLREAAGLSLQALGDMCGRSKGQVWELEKESANPTIKTAYAVAKVLGISVYDIWPDQTKIIEEIITVRRVVMHQGSEVYGPGCNGIEGPELADVFKRINGAVK